MPQVKNLKVAQTLRVAGDRDSSNQLSPDHVRNKSPLHRMSWHWEEGALAVPLNRLNSLSAGQLGRNSGSPPSSNLDRSHHKSHKFASGSLHDAAPHADFDHCESERQVYFPAMSTRLLLNIGTKTAYRWFIASGLVPVSDMPFPVPTPRHCYALRDTTRPCMACEANSCNFSRTENCTNN